MAKRKIDNYVFSPGMSYKGNLVPNAYSLIDSNVTYIVAEAIAYIEQETDAGNAPFNGYVYNQSKCERDIGYILSAYKNDLRYGGNEKTRQYASKYWENDVSQLDGDRQPEVVVHTYIKTLIKDYILTNAAFTSLSLETQVIDNTKTAEAGTTDSIDTFATFLVDVIENGLTQLPELEANTYGYIKIQGKYDLSDILLITNNTANESIFNFTNNDTGAVIEVTKPEILSQASDNDFPKYKQTTDGVTTLKLNANTSSQSADDDIQIFIEYTENGKSITTTRPHDFGTDAIERMRVAPSVSMLDADFEYGLQPTKWSAIGMMRGYPSLYEVPGSEQNVKSIVTDASEGTDGVGASLITVTTVGAHGYEEGDAFTIKALDQSIAGSARAEGSYVIISIIDQTQFTYYAKGKVGTTNGDRLDTTYVQLRSADFYTGSNIGIAPKCEVLSNGASGAMVAELSIAAGETRIPYDGTAPELGAPLVHAGGNIPEGAQVTQTITQSTGGGTFLTADVSGDANSGTNQITVADATGIITDLAIDRGDGQAIFVTDVSGEIITFSDNLTRTFLGVESDYTSISGSNISGIGFDATFNVSIAGGAYTVDLITNGGEGYEVGDRILITANKVGGISPENDLVLIVSSVFSIGTIDGVTIEGTAFDGTASISGLQPEPNGGLGFGATFNIGFTDQSYDTITIDQGGEEYLPNDIIVIPGNIVASGNTPTNDITVTVNTVDGNGAITAASVSGTAPDAQAEYDPIQDADYTYSGTTGSGAEFRINRNGSVYSATVTSVGTNYLPTETFTIDGTLLGGTTITNDCTITIDNVGGSGDITAISTSGTAANVGESNGNGGSNLVGTNSQFTVDLAGGTYTVTVDQGGEDYGVNQTFTIVGSELAGTDVTNDLTITITGVDAAGTITSASSAGTANNGTASFTDVFGENQAPVGSGATFDVNRNAGVYTVTLNTAGNNYAVGNRITILGTELGGQSPLNDITIVVDTIDTGGEILTFTSSYEAAVLGDIVDFIATVTMSEQTTGIISDQDAITFSALASLRVTTDTAHGLVPGDTFIVAVGSDDAGTNNHNLAAGSFIVTSVPAVDQIEYQARAAGFIDDTTVSIDVVIYPRPDAFFTHRPFDGGVQLGTGGPQHGAQAIRQSKKYIRYQSGKGIMYTTGALFAPSYDIRSVTADGVEVGSTITIVTDDNDHGLQIGGIVRLIGVETEGYNSGPESFFEPKFDYTVTNVIDERTYQVQAQRRLGSTTAVLGFAAQMSTVAWHGATVRSGIFDDQNGIFWEYDGTQLSVVQRTGTKQVAGTIAVKSNASTITGTNTRFREQLKAGDRIIIKGMTHVISHINSNTSMTVTPDFRGVIDVVGAKAMLITDKKVKQSEFNLDRMDGTGPSGYDFDHAKMQMIGIQYSWYGAGFIDYMVRGSDGNFVFAHRMRNSNVNTEAFMRSGNLPVRYEVSNEGPSGKLAADVDISQTTLELEDSSFFPDSGTIYIDNEVIRFTGNDKSTHTLTGLTRGSTLTNFQAGATRAYSAGEAATHDEKTGVILISQTITPLISHWGSAFITDGGFDEDRGYIFSYTEPSLAVSTTKQTAFLLRLAPSVSNAIIGDLGERELLNRAQLLLQGIEVTSDTGAGGIVVEGILNPKNYPTNPANVAWAGLATEAQGGQPSFTQVAPGSSVEWTTGVTATTANLSHANLLSGTAIANDDSGSRSNYLYMRYDGGQGTSDINLQVGDTVFTNQTDGNNNFPSGTTVTYINGPYIFNGNLEVEVGLSRRPNQRTDENDVIQFRRGGDFTNDNKIFATAASFNAASPTVGTAATATSAGTFPANTLIQSIQEESFAGTTYYRVTFNNSFSGTLTANTGTITLTFEEPPFAQPGETVFSFIATPGERSMLSLEKLQALTNTTLGGRGTFPNGPDVLAINIYKTTGAEVNSNVILRWGEAQA